MTTEFGPISVKLSQLRPGIGQQIGQFWPHVGQLRPTFAQHRLDLAEFGRIWPESSHGPNSARLHRHWLEHTSTGPEVTKLGRESTNVGPMSAKFDQTWPQIDQRRPNLAMEGPNLDRVQPNLARCRPNLDHPGSATPFLRGAQAGPAHQPRPPHTFSRKMCRALYGITTGFLPGTHG